MAYEIDKIQDNIIRICHIGRLNCVMANLVIKATGRDNIRFFNTEAEALVWLQELNH